MSGHEETTLELTRCPECDALAEVAARFTLASTDGPVEHARVVCVLKHRFVMPAERLAVGELVDEPSAPESSRVRRRRD